MKTYRDDQSGIEVTISLKAAKELRKLGVITSDELLEQLLAEVADYITFHAGAGCPVSEDGVLLHYDEADLFVVCYFYIWYICEAYPHEEVAHEAV